MATPTLARIGDVRKAENGLGFAVEGSDLGTATQSIHRMLSNDNWMGCLHANVDLVEITELVVVSGEALLDDLLRAAQAVRRLPYRDPSQIFLHRCRDVSDITSLIERMKPLLRSLRRKNFMRSSFLVPTKSSEPMINA